MTPEIHFDEATHTYTRNGVVVRYWSQIAIDAGLAEEPPAIALERVTNAKHRGTQIHDACALILEGRTGTTLLKNLHEESRPYVEAFMAFLVEYPSLTRSRAIHVETPLYNEALDYCCTPDFHTQSRVYDIKTTAKPSRTWGLQTAAQALAHGACTTRVIVWLRPKLKTKTYEVHVSENCNPRIFSELDFRVVEAACRGDYDAPCIQQWKDGG